MARRINPTDAHAIMNALAYQATGRTDLAATDTSSFVSVGETVLNTGIENVLGALSQVIGKTFVAVKPYTAKITLIQEENTGLYTSRMRKISFYDKDAQASGWVNTDTYTKNLYDGASNTEAGGSAVGSMWEQNKPIAIEFNFGGSSTWDFSMTFYEDQLKTAFRSEQEFMAFWNGLVVQKQNEMEQVKEAWNRMTLLNAIAGTIYLNKQSKMPGSCINLTKEFNDKFGTTYRNKELLSTHATEFLQFMTYRIKQTSDHLEERTIQYHWSPSKVVDGKTYNKLVRHTPKADQRLIYYKELFEEAKAMVYPAIFNPNYINEVNGEGVTYWQAINAADGSDARFQINIAPAIPNTSDPSSQTKANAVKANVVACLYDKDAIMTNFQFEGSDTTPIEARKKYRNTWWHNMKNAINDFTENIIVFVMDDSYLGSSGGGGGVPSI